MTGTVKSNNQPAPAKKQARKRIPFTGALAAIIIAAPTGV